MFQQRGKGNVPPDGCVRQDVDPEAEEKAAQKAKAHEEAEKVKAEAKAKLGKMLDQVEKLAD